MEGFGEQIFGDVRAVGVGRVEEVDAEIDGAAKQGDGGWTANGRLAPGTLPDEAHGAVAEPVQGQVISEQEGVGGGHFV